VARPNPNDRAPGTTREVDLFRSLARRLLSVPKAEADKQKPLATKKQSRPKQSTARG